jgi:hypothetical protein
MLGVLLNNILLAMASGVLFVCGLVAGVVR